MKKALIVSTNKFPQGDAGAIREESFAKLFQKIGYEVLVAGLGQSTGFQIKQYSGIDYISLRSSREDYISRYCNRRFYSKRLKKYVLNDSNKYDCVLFVNGSCQTVHALINYQEKNNCVLLHDSVEWYSPEEFKYGKMARAYRNKNYLNQQLIDEHFRVIAISKYLEKHFCDRGLRTKRIPVILDIQSINFCKDIDNSVVTFLYAGSPGKKDYLSEIVTAFSKLSIKERNKCKLNIIGVTKEQLSSSCGVDKAVIDTMGDCLSCFGRVKHDEVLRELGRADFTVLLRPSELRYAKAGFPTKFVESLATGTPVICNLSSDLNEYLLDEINGIICDSCSAEAMVKCIRRAIALSAEKRIDMYSQSRMSAEKYFDFRLYADVMEEILV